MLIVSHGVKKYFIAIVIPEPLMAQVEGLKQQLYHTHGLKGALRSPAHITLHRPFEWKEEKETELIEKLRTFSFEKEFVITLKNFDFFEPRVVFVDVIVQPVLNDLHQRFKDFARMELKMLNEVNDLRGFHPHVTIAFRDLKKRNFYELQKEFKDQVFNGSFHYDGFSLMKLEQRWEQRRHFDIGK
jgi:2'-5' RNA ligase